MTFKSAENIAGMTLNPIPYELSLTAAELDMVEIWLALIECDIVGPDDEPLFQPGMDFGLFTKNMSAVWQNSAELFWKIHELVREVNPQWQPAEEAEGNE